MEHVGLAFAVTLFAGLSTGIGSLLALVSKKTNLKFLSVALGFSAGVMVYVSMTEIIFKAKNILVAEFGMRPGSCMTIGAFFAGIAVVALIDRMVPDFENPHEMHRVEEMADEAQHAQFHKRLLRMGILSAVAIAIHNFPEGLATFTSVLREPAVGIPIACAIAIHNIPEGIAVSIPIFYATESRWKAFIYSFLSGLAEPLGAVIGYLLLATFMNDAVYGVMFASVAGIMVYISFDQLLPTAEKYGEHHLVIYGLLSGMAVMAVSLLLFV